ncbi:hypothetical protein [Sneathiella glossodoripedis]|uniref:hypothetical protein n=1 Tax=Sneathiella glossodoripedis TaxID=418853 RepID=UPI000471DC30|nr:hypothetical protein [Sneathiella glossodoripedis]
MIDWNKPIETTYGGEAFLLKFLPHVNEYVVTYKNSSEYFTRCFYPSGDCTTLGNSIRIRNKPELIKPSGYVAIAPDGSIDHSKTLSSARRFAFADGGPSGWAAISLEELISGKFKDGIPVGYGLEGREDA